MGFALVRYRWTYLLNTLIFCCLTAVGMGSPASEANPADERNTKQNIRQQLERHARLMELPAHQRLTQEGRLACVQAVREQEFLREYAAYLEERLPPRPEVEATLKRWSAQPFWPLPASQETTRSLLQKRREELTFLSTQLDHWKTAEKAKKGLLYPYFSSPVSPIEGGSCDSLFANSLPLNHTQLQVLHLPRTFTESQWLDQPTTDATQSEQTDRDCVSLMGTHASRLALWSPPEPIKKPSSPPSVSNAASKQEGDPAQKKALAVKFATGKELGSSKPKEGLENKTEKKTEKSPNKNVETSNPKNAPSPKLPTSSQTGSTSKKSSSQKRGQSTTAEIQAAIKDRIMAWENLENKNNEVSPQPDTQSAASPLPAPPTLDEWKLKTLEQLNRELTASRQAPELAQYAQPLIDESAIRLNYTPASYDSLLRQWRLDNDYYTEALRSEGALGTSDALAAWTSKLSADYLRTPSLKDTHLGDLILKNEANSRTQAETLVASLSGAIQKKAILLPDGAHLGLQKISPNEFHPVIYGPKGIADLITGKISTTSERPIFHPLMLLRDRLEQSGQTTSITDESLVLVKGTPRPPVPPQAPSTTQAPSKELPSSQIKETDPSPEPASKSEPINFGALFGALFENLGDAFALIPDLLKQLGGRVTMSDIVEALRHVLSSPDVANALREGLRDPNVVNGLKNSLGRIDPSAITPEMKEAFLRRLKAGEFDSALNKLSKTQKSALIRELENPFSGMAILREALADGQKKDWDYGSSPAVQKALTEITTEWCDANDSCSLRVNSGEPRIKDRKTGRFQPFNQDRLPREFNLSELNGRKLTDIAALEDILAAGERLDRWLNSPSGKQVFEKYSPLMQAEIRRRLREGDYIDLDFNQKTAGGGIVPQPQSLEATLLKENGIDFYIAADVYRRGSYSPIPEGWTKHPEQGERIAYECSVQAPCAAPVLFQDPNDAETFSKLRTDFERQNFLYSHAEKKLGENIQDLARYRMRAWVSPDELARWPESDLNRLRVELKDNQLESVVQTSVKYSNELIKAGRPYNQRDFKNIYLEKAKNAFGSSRMQAVSSLYPSLPVNGLDAPALGLMLNNASIPQITGTKARFEKKVLTNPKAFIETLAQMPPSASATLLELSLRASPEAAKALAKALEEGIKAKEIALDLNPRGQEGQETVKAQKPRDEIRGRPKLVMKWPGNGPNVPAAERPAEAIQHVDATQEKQAKEAIQEIFGQAQGTAGVQAPPAETAYKLSPEVWLAALHLSPSSVEVSADFLRWTLENRRFTELTPDELAKYRPYNAPQKGETSLQGEAVFVRWLTAQCRPDGVSAFEKKDLARVGDQEQWDFNRYRALCP